MKRVLSKLLIAAMVILSLGTAGNHAAHAATMNVWTASSYENIFQDAVKPLYASASIDLVMAKNEFESAQVLLRSDSAFTINGVSFSNLTSGSNTLAASNLQYHFVEYVYAGANSQWQTASSVVRSAPAYFPDALSNSTAVNVPANSTQSVWVTVKAPTTAAVGTYTGTITVNTTAGNFTVSIAVEVNNVTIPDSKDGAFQYSAWQQIGGTWHLESYANSHPTDNIKVIYGYERWTPQWWSLVADMAQQMKDHRLNVLFVNTPQLLLDGGTTFDASGNYVFNWTKFDEYVQYFMNQGVVKSLESHALTVPIYNQSFMAYLIKKDTSGVPMTAITTYGTAETNKWYDQLLPALYSHLQAKGWLSLWNQSIGDEPRVQAQFDIYTELLNKIRTNCPGMKVYDAFNSDAAAAYLHNKIDTYVPIEDTAQMNRPLMNSWIAGGKDVLLYTSSTPSGQWLNRFVDKPVWQMRSLGWLAYNWGANGYLHWAWNNWSNGTSFISVDSESFKGDDYVVYPDVANNRIKSSIRFEAARDAAEDYELFKLLEQTDPLAAKNIASSIAPDGMNSYVKDISAMIAKRNELVRAAAAASSQVAYWKLNETSGTTAADAWGSATGTVVGTDGWTTDGRDGGGLKFDGVSTGILVGKRNLPPPWTTSMWVKRENASGTTAVLMGSPTTAIKLEQWNNTKKVGITRMGLSDFTFNYEAPVGKWGNLTFTANEKGTSLYVNGQFQETINQVIDLPMDTIGYKRDGATNFDFLKGTLDEVKIYNRALTPAQIAGLGSSSGSVANWRFDESAGAAYDSSGGHTAAVSGGASRAAGKVNNSLVFNGLDGRMDMNMADIPVPWTASLWVRKGANQTSSALMSSLTGALKLDQWSNTYKVGMSKWGSYDLTFNYTAPVGAWQNLTFVGTSSGTSLYVNGVLQDTLPNSISLPMDTMGYRKYGDGTGGDYLNGALDEVQIYNRALSVTEIGNIVQSNEAYWKFDEGAGTTIGDSWGGTSASFNGPTWTASGYRGSALVFDGLKDGIDLGKAGISGQWTASMWVKREDSAAGSASLLGSPEGALKLEQWNNTNKVGMTKFGVADYTFNYTAPIGTWVNLTFVSNGSSTTLYVNGNIQDSIAASMTLPLDTIGYIKANPVAGRDSDYLKGTLDEVKIFRRALSAGEVSQLVQTPGLAYWKFNEGSGTTAADSWGSNTGTVNGASWTTAGKYGNALSFNGTSSKADIGKPDVTGNWTAMMWVKKGALQNSSSMLASTTTALKLSQYPNTGKVGLTKYGEADYTFDYSAPTGQWVHLAFIGTASGVSLYANGVYRGAVSTTTAANLPMAMIGYGTFNGVPTDYLNGTLDEMKLYNRALSPDEIIAAMLN
ncbi:glycoside hydrolase domain-containing protein [Cohnella soli]|uniref:Glycoside hydrolase domain-containing protein n=1 Tax=Cohnella soli TaxID=425005 RepID=A0ABW0HNQ4_9BACL